jgi:hypothetical protein
MYSTKEYNVDADAQTRFRKTSNRFDPAITRGLCILRQLDRREEKVKRVVSAA